MTLGQDLPAGAPRRSARHLRPPVPSRLTPSLLAALLSACGGSTGDPGPAAPPNPLGETCPIAVAVAAPTFSGHVLPVLQRTCGSGSATACHGTPSPVGHVSFAPALSATEVRAQLVGIDPSSAPLGAGWKRVAAGDVGHSWLIEKITQDNPGGTGQAFGNRMPLGLPNLCAPTVQTLKAWIQLGALND